MTRFRLAGLAVAASTISLAGAALGRPAQDAIRYSGEYGLVAELDTLGLEVRWLTEEEVPGFVRAWVAGESVAERSTDASLAHAAHLEVDAPVVTIEYGAKDGERFRTTIRREVVPAEIEPEAPDSVYMFGDVHGQFDRIVKHLTSAGLVDDELHWQGGNRSLVFLGDIFDRGNDVTRVLWLLYGLEAEAREAGGRVHVVLGNHEIMAMTGDLRYVAGKESLIALRHGLAYPEMFDPTRSVLGRWLASKPSLIRLDDMLLAHGGVSPSFLEYGIGEMYDSLRAFMAESLFVRWNDVEYLSRFGESTDLDSAGVMRRYEFFFAPESVLWYRDLVLTDTLGAHLDRVLDRYDSHVHIVAHTPVETIQERYDGKLIAVDLLDAASEMLLMVRNGDGWERFKIPLVGPPEPLGSSLPTTGGNEAGREGDSDPSSPAQVWGARTTNR